MSVDTEAREATVALQRSLSGVLVPDVGLLVRRDRQRTTVRIAALVAVATLSVGAGAVWLTSSSSSSDPAVNVPAHDGAGAPSAATPGRFVPRTEVHGQTVVLPITLPDGTRYELRYPRGAGVAELGFSVAGSVTWPQRSAPLRCCSRVVSVWHTTRSDVYGDATPLARYRGADGQMVFLYRANQGTLGAGLADSQRELVFQFGPWMVQVNDHDPGEFEDRMTDRELAEWARDLDGHVDDHGFLVLTPRAPLAAEPLLDFVFGGATIDSNELEILDQGCGPDMASAADSTPQYFDAAGVAAAAGWCSADAGLRVMVRGSTAFVQAMVDGFSIRPVG